MFDSKGEIKGFCRLYILHIKDKEEWGGAIYSTTFMMVTERMNNGWVANEMGLK